MTRTKADPNRIHNLQSWMPIIIQTVAILVAAFAYSTSMEHRLTIMEQSISTQREILTELKALNDKQDVRLQLLESNQARILALEDYAYRNGAKK